MTKCRERILKNLQEKTMKNIMDMFDEEWERQAIEAEAECGGMVTGRLGSPGDHPIEPVLEDEATLKKFLAGKFNQMLQKEAARKTFSPENSPFPNVASPHDAILDGTGYVLR